MKKEELGSTAPSFGRDSHGGISFFGQTVNAGNNDIHYVNRFAMYMHPYKPYF